MLFIKSLGFIWCTSWMTFDAVFQLKDIFLLMDVNHFILIVVMAFVTGILDVRVDMASFASDRPLIAMIQPEGMAGQ